MELPPETTEVLYKNTIQYLHDIAERVPNSLVLQSYYASKFQISEIQTQICLQKSRNRNDARCPRCCLKLREARSQCVVRAKPKISTFARRLLRKVQTNETLTKFQALYLKKNKVTVGNQHVTTCGFCKKEVVRLMSKPGRRQENVNANKPLPNKKNKKKKKNKDQFCGLQKEAVISALSQVNKTHVRKKSNNKRGVHKTTDGNNRNINVGKNNVKNNFNIDKAKNKVINNPITRRKAFIKKKQEIKLSNILQSTNKTTTKNCLSQFLMSLN